MSTTIFNDGNSFIRCFSNFTGSAMFDYQFIDKVGKMIDEGYIRVECPEVDPSQSIWDGTIYIDFLKPISTKLLVNGIFSYASADEIWMVSDTRLRLWWD